MTQEFCSFFFMDKINYSYRDRSYAGVFQKAVYLNKNLKYHSEFQIGCDFFYFHCYVTNPFSN